MGAFGPGAADISFVGGEEKCAAVAAAHGEEIRGTVGARANIAFDVEGLGTEQVVLEAVHGAQTLSPVGPALGCSILKLRRMAEHQMICRVSVNGAVLANSIEAGCVGADCEGCNAVGAPRVASWL